ncbi:hypothetical protein LTR78_009695 [Recurvomyces mirabilis]|uniref:Uncharacterized protein n=1 Tax=Recurvomyces mirabilis TaxID=574656 RepID=A0AAE0TNF0_9PEZI|nr:hypothetical protein LTR78_009695 [Recurvomyces mirabilis]KAK5150263.1 hypothetical protein LTS14_010239 [Recurvomyces mirabilis]
MTLLMSMSIRGRRQIRIIIELTLQQRQAGPNLGMLQRDLAPSPGIVSAPRLLHRLGLYHLPMVQHTTHCLSSCSYSALSLHSTSTTCENLLRQHGHPDLSLLEQEYRRVESAVRRILSSSWHDGNGDDNDDDDNAGIGLRTDRNGPSLLSVFADPSFDIETLPQEPIKSTSAQHQASIQPSPAHSRDPQCAYTPLPAFYIYSPSFDLEAHTGLTPLDPRANGGISMPEKAAYLHGPPWMASVQSGPPQINGEEVCEILGRDRAEERVEEDDDEEDVVDALVRRWTTVEL